MPSENKPSISEVAAPHPSWINPIRDDAFPAISGNGAIAPVVAAYTTSGKPIIKPVAGKTMLKGVTIPNEVNKYADKPEIRQIMEPDNISWKLLSIPESLPASTEDNKFPIIIMAKKYPNFAALIPIKSISTGDNPASIHSSPANGPSVIKVSQKNIFDLSSKIKLAKISLVFNALEFCLPVSFSQIMREKVTRIPKTVTIRKLAFHPIHSVT